MTRKLDPLIDFKQKLRDLEVGHDREDFILEFFASSGTDFLSGITLSSSPVISASGSSPSSLRLYFRQPPPNTLASVGCSYPAMARRMPSHKLLVIITKGMQLILATTYSKIPGGGDTRWRSRLQPCVKIMSQARDTVGRWVPSHFLCGEPCPLDCHRNPSRSVGSALGWVVALPMLALYLSTTWRHG